MNQSDPKYMYRCLELAINGSGYTAPNPMVGAVLVFENKIIGEGYHHAFGEPHAEVNAISNAKEKGHEQLIEKATLYVSLEPCSHQGKTPPCTDLIIKHKIPQVIIGCPDPFTEVNGKGIKKLADAGINVEVGLLEEKCKELNRRFFTYHIKKRPYILLKYAQTGNNYMATLSGSDNKISNEITDKLVHKWRSEESAIMVGTRTAESDNPMLNVRKWQGKNPVRIVIDQNLRLPKNLNLFDHSVRTIVFNEIKSETKKNIEYVRIDFSTNMISGILTSLYDRNILSVMIEGGANLLNQFIEQNMWDEARIITAPKKLFADGIQSPRKYISGSKETVFIRIYSSDLWSNGRNNSITVIHIRTDFFYVEH